ncbi:hypothetical protein AB3K25_06855 [Leuconostoc sp. MS02]|uniref:Uncharacterized protein n=1 Tax=Leuconostoc aquikimchii TaxID=3236804 RepID=A0ABV3S223_9LACO
MNKPTSQDPPTKAAGSENSEVTQSIESAARSTQTDAEHVQSLETQPLPNEGQYGAMTTNGNNADKSVDFDNIIYLASRMQMSRDNKLTQLDAWGLKVTTSQQAATATIWARDHETIIGYIYTDGSIYLPYTHPTAKN